MRLINFFVAPKLRSRALGGIITVPSFAWVIYTVVMSWRYASSAGFYELDNTGRPIRFLSKFNPPRGILGRTGTGRKAFLGQPALLDR